jgi:ketosteroid isomerase-like protein
MKGAPDPMEMDARQTLIWEKREGKWAIIHEHNSAPLPPGPGSTPKSE